MKTIDELVGEVAKNLGAHKLQKPIIRQDCKSVTLDMAKEIATAAEIAAKVIGVKIVVSIVNDGANLLLLHAMDDSYIASIKASQDKAYTAVALKMPTDAALKESRGGALDGLTNGNGILLLGGGYPLEAGNKIYGGIGISGGTKQEDTLIAAVAAEYFRIRYN